MKCVTCGMTEASYGVDRPMYCTTCKGQGKQKNFRSRMCEGCGEKEALYAFPHERRPRVCSKCMIPQSHINVKHPRCGAQGCDRFVRRRGYLCTNHTTSGPHRARKYEQQLLHFFQQRGLHYSTYNACPRPGSLCPYRPDFVFSGEKVVVIVECDEDQHREYDQIKERQREDAIRACFETAKRVTFIRFCPNGLYTTPQRTSKCPRWVVRCRELERILLKAMHHPEETPSTIKMYYDT